VTLHVLFPALLLPALDLLDRGLVEKVYLLSDGSGDTLDSVRVKEEKEEEDVEEQSIEQVARTETEEGKHERERGEGQTHRIQHPGGYAHDPVPQGDAEEEEEEEEEEAAPSFFLVRSSASSSSSHRHRAAKRQRLRSEEDETKFSASTSSSSSQRAYIVRLTAWNCTCAAFAFAAFASSGPPNINTISEPAAAAEDADIMGLETTATATGPGGPSKGVDMGGLETTGKNDDGDGMIGIEGNDRGCDQGAVNAQGGNNHHTNNETHLTPPGDAGGDQGKNEEDEDREGEENINPSWSFGGISLEHNNTGEGSSAPICKHLLACLLAERWSAALGRYVFDRKVGREEMAGIVADV